MYNQPYNYNTYETYHNSFSGYLNEDVNMMNNDFIDYNNNNKVSKKRHKKSELNNAIYLETSLNTKKLKQNQSLTKICKLSNIHNEDSNENSGNEKARLISINEAFDILRVNIPTFPYERRLSKIDTLHLAISYINLLELVIESNMTMYDYIRNYINVSSNCWSHYKHKPVWATSDLTVRLNWLNWSALGIREDQIPNFLNLFKHFADMTNESKR